MRQIVTKGFLLDDTQIVLKYQQLLLLKRRELQENWREIKWIKKHQYQLGKKQYCC